MWWWLVVWLQSSDGADEARSDVGGLTLGGGSSASGSQPAGQFLIQAAAISFNRDSEEQGSLKQDAEGETWSLVEGSLQPHLPRV